MVAASQRRYGAMSAMAKTSQGPAPLVPPNGGWGWMVVLGVAICNATTQSLLSVFGLLFEDTLHDMGQKTTGAAILMNVMGATTNFSGLVTGPLLRRYSYRKVAMAGGILTSLGLILTSRTDQMWHMIITYSFFVGLGLGLLTPSTFVAVNTYFSSSRGRAVGVSLAGTGVGQMLMPHAIRMLLEEYSFSGTVLVLGAVALHSLAGAALFHPLHWHARRAPLEEELQPLEKPPPRNTSAVSLSSLDLGVAATIKPGDQLSVGENLQEDEDSCWRRTITMFDLDLLRDPVFVNLVVGLAAVYTAGVNFAMVFPFFLTSVGLSHSQTALCMSLLAGGDIACRLILPPLTDRFKTRSRVTFLVGAICLAAIRSLIATLTQLPWLLAVSFLCGFIRGSTVVNLNLSISECCSAEKLPAALGINMVLKGMAILTIGPFTGWIRDESGSFPLCIHILSTLIIMPMAVWLVEMIVWKKHGS